MASLGHQQASFLTLLLAGGGFTLAGLGGLFGLVYSFANLPSGAPPAFLTTVVMNVFVVLALTLLGVAGLLDAGTLRGNANLRRTTGAVGLLLGVGAVTTFVLFFLIPAVPGSYVAAAVFQLLGAIGAIAAAVLWDETQKPRAALVGLVASVLVMIGVLISTSSPGGGDGTLLHGQAILVSLALVAAGGAAFAWAHLRHRIATIVVLAVAGLLWSIGIFLESGTTFSTLGNLGNAFADALFGLSVLLTSLGGLAIFLAAIAALGAAGLATLGLVPPQPTETAPTKPTTTRKAP